MRVGWVVTLVLVIVATMPTIAVGQAQEEQEAQGERNPEAEPGSLIDTTNAHAEGDAESDAVIQSPGQPMAWGSYAD